MPETTITENKAVRRIVNQYAERLDARRERLKARAETKKRESETLYRAAKDMAGAIPFGQPILIGHHSERRDRNRRKRIHNTYGRAFAAQDQAAQLARRAAAVGAGGVSSDDPEALDKLRARVAELEADQEQMKAANKRVKKQDRAGLAALGFTETQIAELLTPDFAGRVGFPAYVLSNNNANIRRLRERITELEARRSQEDVEHVGAGYTYREDVDENRVMFLFTGKPSEAVRKKLSSEGFKWSPKRAGMPWVRQLNNAGKWHAQQVRAFLDAHESLY
jgi:hypothetical protein